MTSTPSSGQILKSDSLARVRTAPERKRELLEEFARSGLSGCKFASLVGVKYQTFAAWVAKRKREGQVVAPAKAEALAGAKVRWLEAVMDQAQTADGKTAAALTLAGRTRYSNFSSVVYATLGSMYSGLLFRDRSFRGLLGTPTDVEIAKR